MTQGSTKCPSCNAVHRHIEGVIVLRCMVCGHPMNRPKEGLTADSAVIYSDSNEAVSAGKGVEVTEPFDELEALMDIEIDRRKYMARKTKTEEIDDLVEDLDELDEEDLDTEIEDVDEVEDDEEDPDEAPKRKRTRKAKPKAEKPEKTGVGTAEVAEAAGIESRQLRMFLRARDIQPRDDREGRYNWPSLNDPEVKMILREIAKGEAQKESKAAREEVEDRPKKKTTTRRKRTSKAAS